jgi:hypothetical protein
MRMTTTDMTGLVREFAQAGDDLPRETMQRALDNWEEAAPPLLALLEAYAAGQDRSDDATGALFFVLHLMGQARDQRAFPAVCQLAQDAEALEAALGDGISSTLAGILIGTYDGDLDRLKAVIENEEADEIVRAVAFDALTWLTAAGAVPTEATLAYLRELHGTMQPQEMSFAWYGWQNAVALLGLEELRPLAASAFEREFIDPTVMSFDNFLEDMQAARESEDAVVFLADRKIAPFNDIITDLSRWHAFSDEYKLEKARLAAIGPAGPIWDVSEPLVNPLRGVGRNDPCPCGSGKKFKKCCLH